MEQPVLEEYNDQGKELREHGSAAFPAACYGGDWRATSVPLHWHREPRHENPGQSGSSFAPEAEHPGKSGRLPAADKSRYGIP